MDFTLTDEQELLRDTARALLAKECPPALLRAHIDDPVGADPLGDHLAEFAGARRPDRAATCACSSRSSATSPRRAASSPPSRCFAPVLAAARDERLEAVLAGEATATVAVAGEDGIWVPNADAVKTFVPEADRVDWIAVVDAGRRSRVVAPADAELRRVADDRLLAPDVRGRRDAGRRCSPLDPDELEDVAHAWHRRRSPPRWSARRAACSTCRSRTRRSAIQFDVPIGSFQAIQHKLAECSLAVERAVAAVQYAVDDDRRRRRRPSPCDARREGRGRDRRHASGEGRRSGPRRHRVHVGARPAPASSGARTAPSTGSARPRWHHDRLADLLLGAA